MKPIKYLLLFATALCVIQRGYYVSEPQRGFGPRFPRGSRSNSGFEHHQKPRFGRFQQDQDTYFQPQQQEIYYRSNKQPPSYEYFQPQQFQPMEYRGPVQPLQLPEQQLTEQQLQSLFLPLYEQLLRIEHKLDNNEQLTEQQIFSLLLLFPDLVELQPLFEQFSQLSQNPQDVQKQQVQQAFQQLQEVQSQVGQAL